jgi:hypothetical protein
LRHEVVGQLVDAFFRTHSQIVHAVGRFYLVFELFDFLLLFFEQSPHCVQSLAEVLFVFQRFASFGVALVKGFEFVLELIVFPHENGVSIVKGVDFLL